MDNRALNICSSNFCSLNNRFLAAAAVIALFAASTAWAQSDRPTGALRYQWTPGQTLRYVIQRDPYFADPAGAVAAVHATVPYQPPIVERLTEEVKAVGADGTATLVLTLTAEPGFEDEAAPQKPLKRTVTVTPSGRILTMAGGVLGSSPAERDLLRGLPLLTSAADTAGVQPAVWTRAQKPSLTEQRAAGHDGTLLRTTRAAQSDRIVFDRTRGTLVRQESTLTISSRLVMTERGRRGVADFGRVVPHTQLVQTLTVERQDDQN